ncbi:hypothetical protein AMS68_000036 [Peltaster fructicola]|uniref:Alb1-domain-containing protein n=1 Tax=Peltaster fructicola TaxID=286661 RepID=A0A6H0XIQ5_9PEZI|nr:hypothetical protein AMS68_000036 [Peltaster fructicola]
MAKIAKPKKREASVHSRAYRRNATPPTEVANKPGKNTADENEHWMYNAQNAGVHKKTKTRKGATRQQHARHAKALEKADRNSAVLENKVAKSKLRGKQIQARAKDWDELNEELVVKVDKKDTVNGSDKDALVAMDGVEEQPPMEPQAIEQNNTATVEQESSSGPVLAPVQESQQGGVAVDEPDVIT